MEEDRELIRRAKAGDMAAFDELLCRHAAGVHAFLSRYLGSSEEAEDATQEAFVKAWRNLARFDEREPLKPWLFRIARNAGTDLMRKRRTLPFAAFDDAFAEQVPDIEPLPEELFAKAELGRLVADALASLAERDQLILTLRYFEGFSFEEMARILGENAASLRSIHRRALGKLRLLLAAHATNGEVDT